MTHDEAARIVLMLVTNWPNTRAEPEMLKLYETVILPLDAEDTEAVVMKLISTCEDPFLPKPATICRLVAERRLTIEGRAMLSAEEAWAQVESAIRFVGYYSYPSRLPSTIRRAIDAIGWQNLCTDENVAASRAHFMRIFESLQRRELEHEVEQLVGNDLGWALPDNSSAQIEQAAPRALESADTTHRERIPIPTDILAMKPLRADLQELIDGIRTKAARRRAA